MANGPRPIKGTRPLPGAPAAGRFRAALLPSRSVFLCTTSSRLQATARGRSSGVERNLAKVEVEGSNPFARSRSPPGPRPNRGALSAGWPAAHLDCRRGPWFLDLATPISQGRRAHAASEEGITNGFQGARTAATPFVRWCPGASSALRRDQRKDRALAAGVPAGAGAAARDGCGAR